MFSLSGEIYQIVIRALVRNETREVGVSVSWKRIHQTDSYNQTAEDAESTFDSSKNHSCVIMNDIIYLKLLFPAFILLLQVIFLFLVMFLTNIRSGLIEISQRTGYL